MMHGQQNVKFTKVVNHIGINNHVERRDYCKDKLGDQANIQSVVTLLPKVTIGNTGTLLYYNKGNHGSIPKQCKHKCT